MGVVSIGDIYGQLTVIKNDSENSKYWICKCSCGNIKSYAQSSLRNGRATRCRQCGLKARSEKLYQEKYESIKKKNFKYITVLNKNDNSGGSGHSITWKCQCKCGTIMDISTTNLLKDDSENRTCNSPYCIFRNQKISNTKTENLIGQKFGELKVIERDYDYERHKKNRTSYWLCECSCGNKIILSRTSLVNNSRYACDFCSKGISTGEKIIQNILDENDIIYKKQVTFRDLFGINNGHCKFDFGIYSRNNDLIKLIEYDGEFHYMKVDYLNSETVKQNDIIKNNYCLTHNIPLVRIPYWEKENINLDMILGDEFLWQKTEK